MRLTFFACPLFALLLAAAPLPTFGQDRHGLPPLINEPDKPDPTRAKIEKEQAKKASQQRQLQLKRDTDKLLALATELKQYVDKSDANTLSLDVVKKAGEIEKLAKSVKDKMKGD